MLGRRAGVNGEARGFMRHGAWMVAASLTGGVAMMLVHSWVSRRCGGPAYAEFKTLLSTFYGVAAVGGGLWPVSYTHLTLPTKA